MGRTVGGRWTCFGAWRAGNFRDSGSALPVKIDEELSNRSFAQAPRARRDAFDPNPARAKDAYRVAVNQFHRAAQKNLPWNSLSTMSYAWRLPITLDISGTCIRTSRTLGTES